MFVSVVPNRKSTPTILLRETYREDTALDGFYVIRTSVGPEVLSAEEAVEAYKDLSHGETAFRFLKTVDLEIRPIYHALSNRVHAHAFLCMLSYCMEWHTRRDLAPMLFADLPKTITGTMGGPERLRFWNALSPQSIWDQTGGRMLLSTRINRVQKMGLIIFIFNLVDHGHCFLFKE